MRRIHRSVQKLFQPDYDHTREWEAVRKYLRRAISQCGGAGVVKAEINDCPMMLPTQILEIHERGLLAKEAFPLSYTIEKPQSDWLMARLKPGDIAVDVGAAWGILTAMMAQTVGNTGSVIAFEPAPTTFSVLQQVMELNSIKNTTLENSACGDVAGTVEFIEYRKDPNEASESWVVETSKIRPPGVEIGWAHRICKVQTVVLDDYLANKGRIAALKIDVEGFEMHVLRGLDRTLTQSRPALCIDIHDDTVTKEPLGKAVCNFLTERGYRAELQDYYGFFEPM